MLQHGLATFSLAKWSLLFKACRDGASTATRGNEFQLSTTQMGRDVDLDLYRATYGLIQLAFVPSYCCTSIHFQEADVDTVQAMRILYLKVSVMCLLSLGRYFVLDYFRIEYSIIFESNLRHLFYLKDNKTHTIVSQWKSAGIQTAKNTTWTVSFQQQKEQLCSPFVPDTDFKTNHSKRIELH